MKNNNFSEVWQKVKLSDLGKILTGNTPSTKCADYYNSNDVMFIKPDDLRENKLNKINTSKVYISSIGAEKSRKVPAGSILVTCIGTIGKVAIVEDDACFNQQINAIIPDNNIVDAKFLGYVILKYSYLLKAVANAPIVPIINKTQFSDIEINIPYLEIQKKIVEVLEKAEKALEKKKEANRLLDELVKSRFIEMFGDLKGEKHLPLEKCTHFIDYRGKTPYISDNGIRIINAKSVGKGFFKHIDEYISEDTYNSWMKRGFPVAGDVLFVTEGHTFGNVCRIPSNLQKFAMGQRVITIQGNKEVLNNAFLAQYMQTMSFQIEISKYKTGSSAQGIRSKNLQRTMIPIPPIELQNEFADFVKQIDKLKFEMQNSLEEMENNFNSLMQRAFKGELFN